MRGERTGSMNLRLGVFGAAAAVAVQGSAQAAAGLLHHTGSSGLLTPAPDRGLAAWATAAAAGAAIVASAAALRRRTADIHRLFALSALICFLAVDRITNLHDRLGYAFAEMIHLPRVDAWPAPLIYAPLLLLTAAMLWSGTSFPTTRATARAGVVLLGLSLAMRPLALAAVLALSRTPGGTSREAAVSVQGAFALAGWILVATALLGRAVASPEKPALILPALQRRY